MYSKEVEQKIDELIKRIMDRKEESLAATYKDVPDLKEIERLINKGLEEDKDTLLMAYNTFLFLSEQYTSLGRFSISASFNFDALKIALLLKKMDVELDDAEDVLYSLLRDRNFYVDDDCEDVKRIALELLDEDVVEQLFNERKRRPRTIKHDPVEMSKEYLDVIDEIEERIEQNRTLFGMGSCFEIWSLKEEYLAEKGISWTSPALLNPNFHFD